MIKSGVKKFRWLGSIVLIATAWLVEPVRAGKKDDVLNMAWEKELETLCRDPP